MSTRTVHSELIVKCIKAIVKFDASEIAEIDFEMVLIWF